MTQQLPATEQPRSLVLATTPGLSIITSGLAITVRSCCFQNVRIKCFGAIFDGVGPVVRQRWFGFSEQVPGVS